MLTAHSTTSSISLYSLFVYLSKILSMYIARINRNMKQGTIADEDEEMWCVVVVVGVTD